MADQFYTYDLPAEEEYIDMDIIRSTAIFCYRISSPNHTEFECHLSTNPQHKETTISTADELFHKGNLLPPHFSHRAQMEEKLLKDSGAESKAGELDVISIESEHEKSWSKKLKGIRQSLLKLKMSKAYFRSLISMKKEDEWNHRKSQASVTLRNLRSKSESATSLSSTSSSSFSSVSRSLHVLKRSSSLSSEMESSVMGAIAYCKKSQQIYGRKEECR